MNKSDRQEAKDFGVIFDIISRRRARALMSVNVENLLTNWEIGAFLSASDDAFLAVLNRYSASIRLPDNIFQSVNGKCLQVSEASGKCLGEDAYTAILGSDRRNYSGKEANRVVVEYALSRTMSPVRVAQYKKLLIPKEVLQRTFEEYLALPEAITE